MREIGPEGEVTREDYSDWPLFREFRSSSQFLTAYRGLFGNEFVVREVE